MSTRPADPAAEARTLTVSPMRRRHLPDVLAIEAQVYPRPWSARLFEDELERSGRVYLVARLGTRVVGYAGVLMIADDGHIATIAVDPAWHRHGIARCLLVELVRRARDLGAAQLTLEVRVSNRGAQDLYRSLGFAPGGARKAYYADNGEDALVMWAHEITTEDYDARLQRLEGQARWPVVRQGFAEPAEDRLHPASSQEAS